MATFEPLRVFASYPKSGNTWARMLMLNFMANNDDPINPNEMAHQNFFPLDDAEWLYQLGLGVEKKTLSGEQNLMARSHLQTYLARAHKFLSSFPGMKTHCMNSCFESQVFPLINWDVVGRVVVLTRHPVDVARSIKHHFGYKDWKAVRSALNDATWCIGSPGYDALTPVGSWSTWHETWFAAPTERVRFFKYEEMPGNFGAMIGHFGIEQWKDRDRIEKAVKNSSLEILKGFEEESGFEENSVVAGGGFFGGAREEVPEDVQIGIIEDHGEMMERLGYEKTIRVKG